MTRELFTGGKSIAAGSGRTLDCVDPATGETFDTVAAADAADIDRVERVSDALDAGITWQNCNNMVVIQAPWRGVKKSGMGRELGRWGLGWYAMPAEAAE